MLVVYMMYDIIVFKNLRSRPCTRRREASESPLWVAFLKKCVQVTIFTRYVWKKFINKTGYISMGPECIRYLCAWYAILHDLLFERRPS